MKNLITLGFMFLFCFSSAHAATKIDCSADFADPGQAGVKIQANFLNPFFPWNSIKKIDFKVEDANGVELSGGSAECTYNGKNAYLCEAPINSVNLTRFIIHRVFGPSYQLQGSAIIHFLNCK